MESEAEVYDLACCAARWRVGTGLGDWMRLCLMGHVLVVVTTNKAPVTSILQFLKITYL